MADDRFPWRRSESIAATMSDKVRWRPPAISFSPAQNASSRLTLVLWPATTIERLTTGDFMTRLHHQADADPGARRRECRAACRARAWTWFGRTARGWPQPPGWLFRAQR